MNSWKMKEIIVLMMLSVACGVLYLGWSTLWLPMSAIFGPVGSNWMFGIWVIARPLVAYIIQKPGAALIAEVVAAAVELFTGSHFGLSALLIGFAQGIGAEIAFALFGYRKFNTMTLVLSGMFAAIGSMVYSLVVNGFAYYTTTTLLLTFSLQLVSGALLGGLLAKIIVDALVKTGTLNGYAIGRKRQKRDAA